MKTKLMANQILNSIEPLQRLVKKELPIKVALLMKNNIRELNKELETISQTRMEIFQKYGTKDDKSQMISVQPDNPKWEEFQKDYQELITAEVEVELTPVDPNLLEKIDITLEDLLLLDFLFIEPTEEKAKV
jgi:hypothetical protein